MGSTFLRLDEVVRAQQKHCYITPGIRTDPEHPDSLYLEYGVKAVNYHDTDAFWSEWGDLKFPDNNYDRFLQAAEREQSVDCDAHPFFPRKQPIYAETAVQTRPRGKRLDALLEFDGRSNRRSEPPITLGDPMLATVASWSGDDRATISSPYYVSYCTERQNEPQQNAGSLGPGFPRLSSESSGDVDSVESDGERDDDGTGDEADDDNEGDDNNEEEDEDDDLWTPTATSTTTRKRTFARRGSTPPTSPETSPASLIKHSLPSPGRSYRSPSPADSTASSGDEYAAPKRKARNAASGRPSKRARHYAPSDSPTPGPSTPASVPPAAAAFSSSNPQHPPLPTTLNARGKWSCPYAECMHETGAFGDLLRHLESLAHQPEKKHSCPICECTFTRVDALKRHNARRPDRCKQIARERHQAKLKLKA